MKAIVRPALALITLLLATSASGAQTPPASPFQDGSRVVAVGDSITNAGLYQGYVYLYHLTRFPERQIDIFNAGISGDTAQGASDRYGWDIEPLDGNAASVMFGMNDVSGSDLYPADGQGADIEAKRLQRVDAYEANMRALVKRLMDDGIDPILLTPSPYDDTSTMEAANQPGRNAVLAECGRRVEAIAAENGLVVVDFNTPMTELNQRLQQDDPAFTLVGKDRVHPGESGHLVMAYLYLKGLNAPADVARVSLDARTGAVADEYRCAVSNVKRSADSLSFDYLAEGIPFPVSDGARPALDWIPFTDELNREMLTITDLPKGSYRLSIDGKAITTLTAAELGAGVNLTAYPDTPQNQQAKQVQSLYNAKYRSPIAKLRAIAFVEHACCRGMPHPLTLQQVEPKLENWVASARGKPYQGYFRKCADEYKLNKPQQLSLMEQAEQALPAIRAAAQPRQHQISVTRI
ncbi:SGNH/GDSL hydrolase family protein [Ruficoccus amylovorans]|uniref:SGNH/GDSL hydrolase family protein n=1 Tax=Ruficoccus amylovorans TaxID=1804625 RepID=A0A842HDV9_9BACT|nr:SGNH/GDSL hydrolase family protein [Ruficoccus amylovorans]MBC2594419.1 SGNH/GDSL hydrolase family protein [Ruficoccus amylovorans]